MPTKRLPENPSLDHLRGQAKDLHRLRDPQTCQRIREFHPRFHASSDAEISASPFLLAEAYLTLAREYGFRSWPRLLAYLKEPDQNDEFWIEDPVFREAVEFLDSGDVEALTSLLSAHPDLATRRVSFEGGNYFQNPSLLEFIAENPVRNDHLPVNILEIARSILDAGADQRAKDETLGQVSSGRVPREFGVQGALIDLLCVHGANPNGAILAALGHGEFEAADALLRNGAFVTLPIAAAMGLPSVAELISAASLSDRHLALAFASLHGRVEATRLLMESGEDPNRYNPVGAHSHSTPLHQAAFGGHLEVVRLLVSFGARLDLKDTHYQGTPLDWAEHGGHSEVVNFLKEAAK